MKKKLYLLLSVLFVQLSLIAQTAPSTKPNIVVVLVDDMGFSDLSCYGGDIPTPNLDALAQNGIRVKNFYNTARCCPSRASILTGLYPQQTGIGYMAGGKLGKVNPAYQGFLNNNCATMAQLLKPQGYHTIMAGKWHIGHDEGMRPIDKGFDRSLNAKAGGFYFSEDEDNAKLFLDGKAIKNSEIENGNWYTTDLWTKFTLGCIDQAKASNKPFFVYLAHNAPHFPVQAPKEDIQKFIGKFSKGWEVLRKEKHERQIKMGLIKSTQKLPIINQLIPKWDTLSKEEKIRQDNIMAIYAATVSRLDKSIGDLVQGLKDKGVYENTIIMFMSDNGGNAEGKAKGITKGKDWGSANSSVFISQGWAELSNTPYWLYKHNTSEGGIASPFIASWPNGINKQLNGKIIEAPSHLIDIMPTCLELAGVTYPDQYNGNKLTPNPGKSLLPVFKGTTFATDRPLFWEHEGNRAMRMGKWKIVSNVGENWQLYNLDLDGSETKDLAKSNSKMLKEMTSKYEVWFKSVNGGLYFKKPHEWQTLQTPQK